MSAIRIIKRSGREEELDIKKIKEVTGKAVEGLLNVEQGELEMEANLQFRDGMSTKEIQEVLIRTAVSKIDIDCPDWSFVAARLFLYDLYHEVSGFYGYTDFGDYYEKGEKEGRLALGVRELYDVGDLGAYIDPQRDLQFTYLGIRTLYDRYLIKNKGGKPMELPQQLFMAVAMFLAQNETNLSSLPEELQNAARLSDNELQYTRSYWAKRFYDVISRFEVMVATPTLSNARTTRHQLSSCYIGSTPDNIEGIFDSYKEMSLLSKYGGGIGWDWSKVRAMGSFIDGHKNASGGTIPFLKITNDIAVAVDQLGTRKGAISVYMEPWHMDIYDFLDLKKNSGEERRRTHDLFPSLWINDLFMKRLEEDGLWTLFCPDEVGDLTDVWGKEFEEKYLAYEKDETIKRKELLKAKDLWKKILTSYFETGSPFLCFKDNANRTNPNNHKGLIRSSNLCTEIFQNTNPNTYKVKIIFDNGEEKFYNEEDLVNIDGGLCKKANKITSIDTIDGQSIYITEKIKINGDTAVCNLASINLGKVNTPEKIQQTVPVAVRMLDNVIDLNFYPEKKVKDTNLKTRSIGLGVMGESEFLAVSQIEWGKQKHLKMLDKLMENISFEAINSSCNLARERGKYAQFEGSNWSKGIFPHDLANSRMRALIQKDLFEGIDSEKHWEELKQKVKTHGMRNGYLMAIAPTSSISILVGTTQAIEPVYKKKWFEENKSGLIPAIVPNLNVNTYTFYSHAYDLDQKNLIEAAAIRQKYIDQSQSLNIFINPKNASGKYLNDLYIYAWKLGIKSCYYLRSQSPEEEQDKSAIDRSFECYSCQ